MQMQTERDLLSRQKDPVVLGTYESDAFVLSLRRPDEFASTHSFGYHRTPHVGVYGMEYSLALPMVLLSLPPTPRFLRRLPQDVLGALDLDHLVQQDTHPPLPTSPQHLLSQRVISTLHYHHGRSSELQLREIAREIVRFSLNSALAKLGLTRRVKPRSSVQFATLLPGGAGKESVVSMASMESEGVEVAARRGHKRVSIQVESTVIEVDEYEEWTEEEEEEVDDDALRMAAKKIVKKALHLACKRWESMNRRSSIDYLIASTKRLKIASPSPPPTLPEEDKGHYEHGVVADLPSAQRGWDTPSPTHSGKKRNRSESHDVMMMRELERFRRAQMEGLEERVFAKPRRTAGRGRGKRESLPTYLPQQESIGELISDIHRLSIQHMDSESDDCCSSEEDYTVLSAVTRPPNSESTSGESSSTSPMPPPNSPTSLQVALGAGPNRSPSPLLRNILPLALSHVPPDPEGEEERTTCTSPEFQQRLSVEGEPMAARETLALPDNTSYIPVVPFEDTPVGQMDCYVVVHTHPPPGLCQKFLCSNTDEVNLIYHCWLFPDVPCDPEVVSSEQLEMGVFQPHGVAPVHQDLQDAGVAFHHLQPRTVCIHNCHFSPENAQLQLMQGHHFHTFFSAARHGPRRVVTLHLVPGAEEVEEILRERLKDCLTLRDLLHQLSLISPPSSDLIRGVLNNH